MQFSYSFSIPEHAQVDVLAHQPPPDMGDKMAATLYIYTSSFPCVCGQESDERHLKTLVGGVIR